MRRRMIERGIYLAPSQYEAMFVSAAHGEEEIERTCEAVRDAAKPAQAAADKTP